MSRLYRLGLPCLLIFCAIPASAGEPLPERALHRLGTSRWTADGYILKLAFSADDAFLYTSGAVIQKWDVKTGRTLETWPAELGDMLDLSRDGKWMLVGDAVRPLRLVDVGIGKAVRTLQKEATSLAAFTPDGKHFLCALDDEKTLVLRDLATGTEQRRFDGAL